MNFLKHFATKALRNQLAIKNINKNILLRSLSVEAIRPYRSILFTPGAREKVVLKAKDVDADGIILDLEDAVAPTAKVEARNIAVNAVQKYDFGDKMVVIRINALNTLWGHGDLRSVVKSGAHAVVIPKVEQPETITQLSILMDQYGAPKDMKIWAMIETPKGVLNVDDIAKSRGRLSCLVVGTSDLTKELNCATSNNRAELQTSLSTIVLAAKANNLISVDGVHLDLSDEKGFQLNCHQAKDLGFDGKTLIHPKTIAYTNETFSPSPEEVKHAEKVIAAHKEACAKGVGIVVVDGKLIENLHVDMAERLLGIHNAIAKRK